MKRKPIKLDWDELESSFNNRNEDLVYYLDLVKEQVVLEGEGEDEVTDPEDFLDEVAPPDPGARGDVTRLYIEPPGVEDEIGWMNEFLAEAGEIDAEVAESLREALAGPDPAIAFRDVLRRHQDERDRWFAFRSECLHEAIDAWVDANNLIPTDPPPWRT